MTTLVERLKALSSAEDFLQFFGITYEEPVVHVNRLHILKRFYQYLHQAKGLPAGSADDMTALNEVEMFKRYRDLLAQAYQDFIASTPVKEKVFKVFQDAQGHQAVSVASLRDSLADRRASPAGSAAARAA